MNDKESALRLLREAWAAMDTIIEMVDLHNAELAGTDICDCHIPDAAASLVVNIASEIDAFLAGVYGT